MSIKSLITVNYVLIAKYLHKNDDRKVQCVYHLNRAIASKIFLDLGGGLFNPGGSFLKLRFPDISSSHPGVSVNSAENKRGI